MVLIQAGRDLSNAGRRLGQTLQGINKIVEERKSFSAYDDYSASIEADARWAIDDTRDPEELRGRERQRLQRRAILLNRYPQFKQDILVSDDWFNGVIGQISERDTSRAFSERKTPYINNWQQKKSANATGLGKLASSQIALQEELLPDFNRSEYITNELLYNDNLTPDQTNELITENDALQKKLGSFLGESEILKGYYTSFVAAKNELRLGQNIDQNRYIVANFASKISNAKDSKDFEDKFLLASVPPGSTPSQIRTIRNNENVDVKREYDMLYTDRYQGVMTDTKEIDAALLKEAKTIVFERKLEQLLNYNYFVTDIIKDSDDLTFAAQQDVNNGSYVHFLDMLGSTVKNSNLSVEKKEKYSNLVNFASSSIIDRMSNNALDGLARIIGGEIDAGPNATLGDKRTAIKISIRDNNRQLFLNSKKVYSGRNLGAARNLGEGDINSLRNGSEIPEVFAIAAIQVFTDDYDDTSFSILKEYKGIRRSNAIAPLLDKRGKALNAANAVGLSYDLRRTSDREDPNTKRLWTTISDNADIVARLLTGNGMTQDGVVAVSNLISAEMVNTNRNDFVVGTQQYISQYLRDGTIGRDPETGDLFYFNPDNSNQNTNVINARGDRLFDILNGRIPNRSESLGISQRSEDYFNDEDRQFFRMGGKGYSTWDLGEGLNPLFVGDAITGGISALDDINQDVSPDAPVLYISVKTREERNNILLGINSLSSDIKGDKSSLRKAFGQSLIRRQVGARVGGIVGPLTGLELEDIDGNYTREQRDMILRGESRVVFVSPVGETIVVTQNGSYGASGTLPTQEELSVGAFTGEIPLLDRGLYPENVRDVSEYIFGKIVPLDGEATGLDGSYRNGALTPYSKSEKDYDFERNTVGVIKGKIKNPNGMTFMGSQNAINAANQYLLRYANLPPPTYEEFSRIKNIIQKEFGVSIFPPILSPQAFGEEAYTETYLLGAGINYYNIEDRYTDKIKNGLLKTFYFREGIR